MRLTHVEIKNFRAHADTKLPLSQFGCLIGENNAGKSTVLHALQFALEGGKLPADDFHDRGNPVEVSLRIDSIDEVDLERVAEGHRDRVREMLYDGTLTLIRSQTLDATPDVRYMAMTPVDEKWSADSFGKKIKGLRGAGLRAMSVELVPELQPLLDSAPSAGEVRDAFQVLINGLGQDELQATPEAFKTGIWQAVKPMLPEVIYIEAVKDATAETKTSSTATFGKLLGLLLAEVSEQFVDINARFVEVQRKLSRVVGEDGDEVDARLPAVRAVEATIEKFVQESFPNVGLRMNVPAPSLTTILGGAELRVNDGHDGLLASKGDGLKRTVLFAILRAYTSLRFSGLYEKTTDETASTPKIPYVLLFEEPELYLHPRGQRQLMSTLAAFAKEHQVLVTTHSAGFFGPSTEGFAKLTKSTLGVDALSVDLDLSGRDAYQLIQYENNEAAFFAESVVLVEGDSDTFTLPHLAKLISPDWDDDDRNITFVKTGGKGSVGRYRSFFNQFEVPVHVVVDLDALVDGFHHLTETQSIRDLHAELMTEVATHTPEIEAVKSEKVKNIVAKRHAGELWTSAQMRLRDLQEDPHGPALKELSDTLEELFDQGRGASKTEILTHPPVPTIAAARDALIAALARERVHVLRRGDLESYCGRGPLRGDKVTVAMQFCDDVQTLSAFRERHGEDADEVVADLSAIFAAIYAQVDAGSSDEPAVAFER
jgi:putative ATP-dependent endonuclease of OLD family